MKRRLVILGIVIRQDINLHRTKTRIKVIDMYNKMIRKLFIMSMLVTSMTVLSSCGTDGIGSVTPPLPSSGFVAPKVKGVSRITTPFQDQGYSNFETTVITSQAELDQFITAVNEQSNWDNKVDFLNNILLVDYDFTKNNLLLYRVTESSDSVVLTPQNSVIRGNRVTISLNRLRASPWSKQANHIPVYRTLGKTGIVNYLLAYEIVNTEKELIVKNGSEETTIVLTRSETIDTHLPFNSHKLLNLSAI